VKPALLAALILLTASCARTPSSGRGRLVVLRFENLTGDPGYDWVERGAARQIAAELDAAVADSTQTAADRQRAIAGGNTRILHGYVSRSGRRLRLHADLEDAASRKLSTAEATGTEGILPLIHSVARQFDSSARPMGARNEDALSAYVSGLDASGAAASQSFAEAIAADPNYGPAYLASIELSLSLQDRTAAEKTLSMARARGEAIPPVDRARLDAIAAQLSGNPAAVSQALARLSQLTPADANLLRVLATSELNAKRFGSSIEYLKKALAVEPRDPLLLNTLGYTEAYAGNFDAAVRAFRDYEGVRPQDANPIDSMAEVHFYYGRFAEAEKLWLQAYEKDPAFLNSAPLIRAAIARLLAGDAAGAEGIFARYEAVQRTAGDPAVEFARARWEYLRGNRSEAMRRIEAVPGPLADCTRTVWLLEAGDRAAAARGTACRFLTEPKSASFPTPMARAYALLLAKDFTGAVPVLREVVARAAPAPAETSPVMLAWALIETGQLEEAQKYLRYNPVPAAPVADPFESLVYPRLFRLREIAAGQKGSKTAP
jgi:tetratricopeptide (TPR) repeat protein